MLTAFDREILWQASSWIERLKHRCPEDYADFTRWLLSGPRHTAWFLAMTALDEELRHFDPERKVHVERKTA